MSGIVGKNAGRASGIVGAGDIGADAVSGANIADDVIDSEHLVAASVDNEHLSDNAVGLAEMAGGTDGQIITYDASGDPVAVGPGSDGEVLTSTGAGSPPAFEAAASGLTAKLVYGTFNMTTASGTTDFTGAGFDPTAIIWGRAVLQNTPGCSWGVMDSDENVGQIINYHIILADTYAYENARLFDLYVSSGNYQVFTAAFITDGVRLSNTKGGTPTGTLVLGFLFAK